MSESELWGYLTLFVVVLLGVLIWADRLRHRVEELGRELERSEQERELLSKLLHPARNGWRD
jgi:cytochrome c-type biogenesis protein CcmH/NrfF